MKVIELKAKSFKIDIKKNTIVYDTGITAEAGILVLSDNTGERGLLLTDQFHPGGEVTLMLKPFLIPAKKYEVDEVVAKLIVIG